MFTALTGLALDSPRAAGARPAGVRPWLLGLTCAILLHAFWNGSAVFGDFFRSTCVQVPALRALHPRRAGAEARGGPADPESARRLRRRGWFTPQEVEMLATPGGRRTGLAWAKTLTGDRTATMKAFIEDATALAAARQRGIRGATRARG